MSDIDRAVNHCKRLESLLETRFGATGRGLHEKVSSVEDRLPPVLVRKLRLVATVRNKIVHEVDYRSIDGRNEFLAACKESERGLNEMGGAGNRRRRTVLKASLVVLMIVVAIAYRVLTRR